MLPLRAINFLSYDFHNLQHNNIASDGKRFKDKSEYIEPFEIFGKRCNCFFCRHNLHKHNMFNMLACQFSFWTYGFVAGKKCQSWKKKKSKIKNDKNEIIHCRCDIINYVYFLFVQIKNHFVIKYFFFNWSDWRQQASHWRSLALASSFAQPEEKTKTVNTGKCL